MAARLAPKVKGKKPVGCGGQMDDEMDEVLADALDSRHKSADGFREDLQEAFDRMPDEQKAHAAAVCRDLGNEAPLEPTERGDSTCKRRARLAERILRRDKRFGN